MKVNLKPMNEDLALGEITLNPGEYLVGRSADCDCKVTHPTISRRHCELDVKERVVRVRDLNSSNGTFVNYDRVDEARGVLHGDVLSLGDVAFEVQILARPNDGRMDMIEQALCAMPWLE